MTLIKMVQCSYLKKIKDYYLHRAKKNTIALLILGIILVINGCTTSVSPTLRMGSIALKVDRDANDTSATPVDIVAVYDQGLVGKLSKLSAAEYFQISQQLVRDNPEQLEVFHYEVVPGQFLRDHEIELANSYSYAVFVFANYIAPGEHRVRLGEEDHIMIHLKRSDFCVRPGK